MRFDDLTSGIRRRGARRFQPGPDLSSGPVELRGLVRDSGAGLRHFDLANRQPHGLPYRQPATGDDARERSARAHIHSITCRLRRPESWF